MIPTLDGVFDKLTEGCLVADVGCGDGAVILALAEAFPESLLHAYDRNKHAVARVQQVAAEMELANVEVIPARGEDLPLEAKYDLVITFDCIRDMTRPEKVMAAIRRSLSR